MTSRDRARVPGIEANQDSNNQGVSKLRKVSTGPPSLASSQQQHQPSPPTHHHLSSPSPSSSPLTSCSQWHRSKKMSTSHLIFTISCLIILLDLSAGQKYNPKWPDPMLRREIFLLNLEDGYFGCQVNDSADFLQLFELSQLCDGRPQCFRGSDELSLELKCSDRNHCHPKMPKCVNGVCLDGLCYCNDGFGGKGCDLPGMSQTINV